MIRLLGNTTGRVGEIAVGQVRKVAASAGMAWLVVCAGLQPRNWPRTVREAWARQVIFSGINAAGITCFLAAALGILLCIQYQVFVGQFNASQILPSVFVLAIVRELGPLVVNIVLIARSGNAIATELGLMHVSREDWVIESQGIDPFLYIVVPRVLGLIFCAICLTVLFISASLVGVFLCGEWIGAKTGSPIGFADAVLALLTPADVMNLVLKSTIPSLIGGCICCLEGMNAGTTAADVPGAAVRAVQRSIIVLFAASVIISVGTYVR